VIVALGAPPASLDPRIATDASGMGISSLVFTALFHLDPELKLVGEFAQAWSYRDLVYSFQLRPGLEFSNHQAVTSQDILFSFSEYMDPKCPFSSNFKMIEKVEVNYSKLGGELKIKLKEYSSSFLTDLRVIKILPQKLIVNSPQSFREHPVGSGNFEIMSDSSNDILLRARSTGSLIKPKIEKLDFKIIRDDYTRFLKLLSQEIDIAENEIDLRRINEFMKRPNEFEVQKIPSLSMAYLLINLRKDIFKNLKVRKALALALNRQDLIQYKLESLALPATSLLSPIHPMHNTGLVNPAFNLAEAIRLLSDVALPNRKISFKSSNAPNAVENASVIIDQFKKLGLKFEQQSFEWGTFYSDIKSGNFELATAKWIGLVDADIYRQAFDSKETPPGRNRGYYKNPKLDELVEKALKTEDFSKRRELYLEAQKIVFDDLPIIPLWYDLDVAIVSRRIKNFKASPAGDFMFANEITKTQ
jgi:peptide/nickel transport system substrate-binding protein